MDFAVCLRIADLKPRFIRGVIGKLLNRTSQGGATTAGKETFEMRPNFLLPSGPTRGKSARTVTSKPVGHAEINVYDESFYERYSIGAFRSARVILPLLLAGLAV